jgi:superfamily II DNA or RNA helicase
MPDVVLTEKLLAGLAGWDVVKQARLIVAEKRVLSSSWQPPVLRGVVQWGHNSSYRAGLVIRRDNDAENLCTCRQSREWGTLCAHSIAIGIHALRLPVAIPEDAPAPSRPSSTSSHRPTPSTSTSTTTSPFTSSHSPTSTPQRPTPRSRDVRRIRRSPDDATATPGSHEALAVQVVLPPNLPDALARGRPTVFFEGRTQRGTVPLATLSETRVFHIDAADARLLDVAEDIAGGDTPAMLQVTPADFARLLDAMVDHPRVSFGKAHAARVLAEPWRPPVRGQLLPTGEIELRLQPLPKPPTLIPGANWWILAGNEFRPIQLPEVCRAILSAPVRIPRKDIPAFLASSLPALQSGTRFEADFAAGDFELSPQAPRFVLHLAGGLASLTANLHATYGPRIVTAGVAVPDEPPWMPDPDNIRRFQARDLDAERAAVQRLRRQGFSGPDAQGRLQLNGQNPVLTFFARDFPRLEREWSVTLEERLDRSTRQNFERIEPQFSVTSSGEAWFDLQVQFTTSGGERLPATEIQRLLRGGQNHTRLRNGRIALIDTGAVEELEEILVDASPEQHGGGYRIRQEQAGFIHASLDRQGWQASAPAAWRDRALRQTGALQMDCPPLGPLGEVLRPYQKHGVAWLAFLRQHGFGGMLADEMGLGKTLQTLALLATTRPANPPPGTPRPPPHLVVCPTSLVFNWAAEAARFTPHLRVLPLHGPGRLARFAEIPDSDLVITSYALVRRDLQRYRGTEFDTVILDEAQHIKNRQTQNAQAVKSIRANHRLVLTGTPLENSVLDLWSIFDFLMPGYLGAAQDFRDRYEVPIIREKSAEAQNRLARRIQPFLLRRLKRDVAPELPARIDQVVWCELSEDQAKVYAQLLEATRRDVLAAVDAQGLAQSRMLVLTAILRLRQVCCDLRLLGVEESAADTGTGTDDAAAPNSTTATPPSSTPTAPARPRKSPASTSLSGKLDAFEELLEEVLDGGHRVLVFSQFTRLLGLLRERLTETQVRFCYLDGSTRDRQAEVAKFQNAPDVPVFLISLKAGGVGLNLTAADTVVHLDPWWNPAVEDQATDRAHRIGQQRVVTNYKLITRGTIEEKILALQQRKRDVLQGILTGEEQLSSSLTWEEIQDLLA